MSRVVAGGTDPVLRVTDVEFSYGALQVLFGISMEVRGGEAVALLGTNGAGKSTLLRVVCGLETPDAGRIELFGRPCDGSRTEARVRDGLVLVAGGRTVFPDMTVAENLEIQALTLRRQRAVVKERRERVFDVFPRLRDRLGQLAGTLSGGEQQQLALAKALLLQPRLLCIDELTLGLAPVAVQPLVQMVKAIHANGVAVLIVEQSLNIAAELCDRAVFLEKGTVRFEGRPTQLLERDDIARAVFLGGEVAAAGSAR